MTFSSRKDTLFSSVILGTCLLLLACMGYYHINTAAGFFKLFWVDLLILGVVVLLFWIYFGTRYELNAQAFQYKSGPLRGTIPLEQIREVVRDTTLWVGFYKPATARKGLIIKFNQYDEIYISPENNDIFINKLLELKSDIRITQGANVKA
ncbi:PH domain-containing protein [Catalinimonas sp. 4WD22]|uniref:PH domain-containing protein n=1 Tax=Catalinimonas locisalis TaxID=3133978 RepID=UPI003101724C